MSIPLLSVNNLTLGWRQGHEVKRVVHNVSFQVNAG